MRDTARALLHALVILLLVAAQAAAQEEPARPEEPAYEGVVRIVDPGDEWAAEDPDEGQVFTPETLVYRRHRWELDHMPGRGGANVGGPAMIGVNLGGRDRARSMRTPELLRERLEDWDGHGAAVMSVYPGSAADDAWLNAGDVIVNYAGLWVDSVPTLITLVSRSELGREYELWYVRGGQVYRTWIVPRRRGEIPDVKELPVGAVATAGQFGLTMPRLLEAPEPEYPAAALERRRKGKVAVEVVVDEEGLVSQPRLVRRMGGSGGELDEAALEIVRERVYEPGLIQGRPVPVRMTIEVDFQLRQVDEPPAEEPGQTP